MYKLAILTANPIQYQAPLFKKIAEHPEIDLTVLFRSDEGVKEAIDDPGFGRKIKWDIPLLEGYNYIFLENSFSIFSQLKKEKYDAVLIHGWNCFTNWLAFLASFIRNIPVFLHSESPLNQELLKPRWKIRVKKFILSWLFKRISVFLYIGEKNKKFYQFYGVPEEKLFFCPYSVDNFRFINEAKKLKTKNLELKANQITILFAGKLIEKKRPFDLLKAYKMLNTKYLIHNAHLTFVGDGILRPQLENYVKERDLKNVHFAGFKNQTELPEHYAMADIFVLPSGIGETWGLVVNEAMCFGLPVIVSNIVGCGPDLIKNNENGYIFPVGDIRKLTKRLADLIKNPEKRKKFGEKSFEIIQDYNYEKDIDGILTALKQ